MMGNGAYADYPALDVKDTQWKTGQVLALSQLFYDPTTFLFEAGTGSRFGHVGLVSVESDGVFVYEEAPPAASRTPLEKFLKTATDPQTKKVNATLLEYADSISEKQINQLVQAAKDIVNKKTPYNFSMVTNNTSMNCSEFVFYLFKTAGLKAVGEQADFESMNTKAFQGKLMELARINNTKQGLSVTPASIVNSPNLKVVSTNLPVEIVISEADILKTWKTSGALSNMLDMFGLPSSVQDLLTQLASDKPYRSYPQTWRTSTRAPTLQSEGSTTSSSTKCSQIL